MTSAFHIIVIGSGAQLLCSRFDEISNGRIKSVAVEADAYLEDMDTVRTARALADRHLNARVDVILALWDEALPRSTSLVFSLTECFRTCKDRIFLCKNVGQTLPNSSNLPLDVRFEAQSTLLFFNGRIFALDSPINVLKSLLKSRPKGPSLQLSILATDDFIKGAIERRDARKQMYLDAANDERARALLERRFMSRMDARGVTTSPSRFRIVA